MADRKDLTIPPQGNMLRDFMMRVRLIWRLMRDGRVSGWLKLIPVAGLLYLVMPIDFIADIALPLVGQVDDAAILWLTNYVFLELIPPEIVMQHVKALTGNAAQADADEVVDAESVEIKDTDK
ncbi:MAG: DUF1232 domain-containing protein [Chloroflexota bacterium]